MKYIIVVDKQSRTNPSTEKRETTIEIEELRRKGNVHDDFVIEKDIAKVYRRLGLTKTLVTYVLDNEVIEELGELKIKLFEGDNYIYIKDEYNNQMCAEFVIKNDFTDSYVTNLQMESAIEESASTIKLYVSQSLENYSNTEQIKAMIQLKADEINAGVEKKVDEETITGAYLILKINGDTSEAKLNADKIELSAQDILNIISNNELNFTSKNLSIKSTYFKLDKNGKIKVIDSANTMDFNNANFVLESEDGKTKNGIRPNGMAVSNQNNVYLNSYIMNSWAMISAGTPEGYTVSLTANDMFSRLLCNDSTGSKSEINSKEIITPKLTQTSLKSRKKYIKKLKVNATDLIKNSDICLYNLKGEKAKSKKHIGLVIGDGYNCPTEVISEDGQGVEQYSMTSLAWKAIQEQQEIIENLKQRIEKLEAK